MVHRFSFTASWNDPRPAQGQSVAVHSVRFHEGNILLPFLVSLGSRRCVASIFAVSGIRRKSIPDAWAFPVNVDLQSARESVKGGWKMVQPRKLNCGTHRAFYLSRGCSISPMKVGWELGCGGHCCCSISVLDKNGLMNGAESRPVMTILLPDACLAAVFMRRRSVAVDHFDTLNEIHSKPLRLVFMAHQWLYLTV